jgi:Na+-transporting methylmalonyl-CoA/oxaloacetate decarboxylase gamma subunit
LEIAQGWTLTVLGLIVAFLAMSIFVGTILLLKKLFPYHEEATAADIEETPAEAEAPVTAASSMEAEVAAIAVAIVAARSARKQHAPIGQALLSGRGSWWAAGQLSARQTPSLKKTR